MHQQKSPSELLVRHFPLFEQLPAGQVLDLACGYGRNGLALAKRGLAVCFADRNAEALNSVSEQTTQQQLMGECWQQDFEGSDNPLAERKFAAILVFNYLHRPLLPQLVEALLPGGVLIYETFLTQQAQLGRPSNPDFLLKPNELTDTFHQLEPIHYSEGLRQNPERYTAQLVARKRQ